MADDFDSLAAADEQRLQGDARRNRTPYDAVLDEEEDYVRANSYTLERQTLERRQADAVRYAVYSSGPKKGEPLVKLRGLYRRFHPMELAELENRAEAFNFGPRQPTALDAVLDDEAAFRDAIRSAAIRHGLKLNPDKVADTLELAKAARLPLPVVERNEPSVAVLQRAQELQYLAKVSPIFGRQLEDPNFAALAHDDAELLSAIEGVFKTYLGASAKSGLESLVGTAAKLVDTLNPFTLSEQDAAVLYRNDPKKLRQVLEEHPATFLSRLARAGQQASEHTMQSISPEAREAYGDLRYATLDPKRAAYLSPVKVVGDAIQSLPTSLAFAVSIYLTRGAASRVEAEALRAGATAEAARQASIRAAAETMAKLGAVTEGAAGFGQQAIQTREAAERVPDKEVRDNPEYRKLLAGGFSPEAARVWLSAAASNQAGGMAGISDAIANYFGGRYLGKLIGERGNVGARILKGGATEAVVESVQSGLEQLAQNQAVQQYLNTKQPLLDDVAESIAQGFFVGGLMGGTFSAHAGRRQRARGADTEAEALRRLTELAQESKLRERAPESFKAFVEQAAAGGAVQDIYVDARTFVEALNQSGIDPAAIAARAPSVAEQLTQALATEGDLRIPVGEFAAHVAPDAGAALLPHLRTDPHAFSQEEARAFFQDEKTADTLRNEVQGFVEQASSIDAATRQAESVVREHVMGQLKATGRFTDQVNEVYAGLTSAFYQTISQRVGESAEALLQRYPLHIVSQLNLTPQSILEQPAYHGSPHDFAKFSTEKIGTGEGAQAYGWGLYFAENPSVAGDYFSRLAGRPEIQELKLGGMRIGSFNSFDYSRNASASDLENVRASLAERMLIDESGLIAAGVGGIQQFALKNLDELIEQYRSEWPEGFRAAEQLRKELARKGAVTLKLGKQAGGVYQVEIPDQAADRMLDWDAPLAKQPDAVKEIVRNMLKNTGYLRERDDGPRQLQSAWKAWINERGGMADGDTGSTIYGALMGQAQMLRADAIGAAPNADPNQVTSRFLLARGVPGIKYLDQLSRDKGKGSRNLVVFDDQFVTITHKDGTPVSDEERARYLQTAASSTRGAFDPASSTIALLQGADLSTFVHESSHFFLEVLTDLAAQPSTPQQVKDDFGALLKWFGVKDLATWQGMTLDQKREYHEKFARGFEAYAFEGEAPSIEMAGIFQRFRAWLLNVYKSLVNLNVELSDEVRAVFGRMLATDEQIAVAEAARAYRPLFESADASGMTAEQWAAYQRMRAEATAEAKSALERRSLRDMKWLSNAKSRKLKELQAQAKEKRAAIEAEVAAEVDAMPVYQAMRWLKTGELPTGEKTVGAKLDIDALKEMYGDGPAAPWRYLATGERGLAGTEGLPPDTVAEMFGFTSGDALVKALLAAGKPQDVIQGKTDQRMLERHGDLVDPVSLERAAEAAIHNDARGRFVAAELDALQAAGTVRQQTGRTDVKGRPISANLMTKAARQFAESSIATKQIRSIRPAQFSAAEGRAARAAEKALRAGELAKAAAHKRAQLVNHELVRVALAAQDEVDRSVAYLRKFSSDSTREKLDVEYLDQIDQLLERHDLRASVTEKELRKRASLRDWLESQREQGYEPDIDPALLAEANRQHFREMALEQFRGLVDAVKQIEHLGRLKHRLLTAQDERDFALVRDRLLDSIKENAKTEVDLRTRDTAGAMLKKAGKLFLAIHRKMASKAREMDGFKDGGPMWEYFIRTMNAGGDREASMREAATKKLYELAKPLLDAGHMDGKGVEFGSLGISLNRKERIAIALNTGNASNLQRLLDGEGWTRQQIQPVLDSLTAEEWGFVQGVWDFFESYRPQIAAKERRIYGKEPVWVEPVPVQTKFGELRGGYYPIKYDPARSGKAEQHADAEEARRMMQGAYTTATTRRSFTKARAEEVTGRPLIYSLDGLYQGTQEVIHDLSWHEWLIDVNRLLRNKAIDAAIRTHYGAETVSLFKKAIEDIATGELPAQNIFETGINRVRTGATIAGLGWNVVTSLLQPLGLTQSMVRIGPGWVARGIGQWMKAPLDTVDDIYSKSEFMRLRGKTMQREINEIRNQVSGGKGAARTALEGTFFILIQKMQLVADVPTWLGMYEKAVADGSPEDRAIALADQAVIDSQGSGQIKDLAAIQRGSPLQKLFTNFYSFFNVAYNLGVEKTKEKAGSPKQWPSLVLDYLLLYSVPAVLAALLKHALKGEDDDELVKNIIGEQISYLLGTMIGLREITAAVQKGVGAEQFKGAYGGPAGLRVFQEIDKLGQQIGQGEADMALFKAADSVAGIFFHYPAGQINKSVEGVAAIVEGKTRNPVAVLAGPPKH
ncbi:MAG: hypothetical protein HYX43_10545 [Burkholderiales bacterium]|nr:hypothetical protein [Burkholderiales bacterium]